MANLGTMQRVVDQYQQDLGGYQKAAKQFNFDADVYNKQLNEYQGMVNAYNNNPSVIAYDAAAKKYNTDVATYNQKANDWNSKQISVVWPAGNTVTDTIGNMYNRIAGFANQGNIRSDLRDWAVNQTNSIKSTYYPGTVPTQPSTQGLPQKPGDFTAVKPELTATMPKDPGFTNQQMDALAGKQTAAQLERGRDSGLVSGAQEALRQSRDEGSMIGGLLARARYST